MTGPRVIDHPERYLPGVPLPPRTKLHPDSPFDQADTIYISDAIIQAAQQRHPMGFNVRPGVDYAKLLVQVQRMGGCRAMVFRCDPSALWRLRDFQEWVDTLIWLPNQFVPERLYLDAWEAYEGPQLWVDGRLAELRAAGFRRGEVWLHLHNEAGWNATMIDWEALAAEHATLVGGKVVCLNCAVGTPEPDQIAMAQPVIELAQEYPEQVLIGLHEYFSVFGNRSAPWYLNRWSFWPDGVRFVITEAGAEDIDDDHPYTATLPRTGDRKQVGPVHANDAAWAATYGAAYPGKDAQYLREFQTAWDVGKWGDPRIVGVCLFSWGDGGGRWADYNVAEDSAFLEPLAGWRPMGLPIEPPEVADVPTLPGKDSNMWKPGRLLTSAQGSNLRDAPFYMTADGHVPGKVLINLKDGAKIAVWLEPNYEADGKRWYGVKHTTDAGTVLIGWMALVAPTFEAQFALDDPVPEPPPVDPQPTPTPGPAPVGNPTLTEADWQRLEAMITRVVDARMGPVLRILSVLMAGYVSDRSNDTRNFNNLMTELQKEIEAVFPEVKKEAA